MKKFRIITLPDRERHPVHYQAYKNDCKELYVLATTWMNPLEECENISAEAKIEEGKVLVDLTMINGGAFNRYLFGKISGGKIQKDSLRAIRDIPEELKKIRREFFLEHPRFLKMGIVSDAEELMQIRIPDGAS
jgi:hypothetical protein